MKTLSRVLLGKDTADNRKMPDPENVTIHPAVPDIKLGLGPVTHMRKSVIDNAHKTDRSQSYRAKDEHYKESQKSNRHD